MARVFTPRPAVVHERFGDETVIVNLETGSYYSAQGSADAIWVLAATGVSESDILDRLCVTYQGDRDAIRSATSAFLVQLMSEGLVTATPAPNGTPHPGHTNGSVKDAFVPPQLQKYTDMEELLLIDPIHEVDELGWPSARKPVG